VDILRNAGALIPDNTKLSSTLNVVASSSYPILFAKNSAKPNPACKEFHKSEAYDKLESVLLKSPHFKSYFIKGEKHFNILVLATLTHEGIYGIERKI